MADVYINELEINGQKRLDLTQDTATPETVLEGETFHLRSGAPATGTYRPSDEIEARLRATVGHSSINLFNEKYRQGTPANLTITTAVTSKTIIPTAIGQKRIFHNFNLDYAYVIYGINAEGVSELLSGKIVTTSNRLYDSGYIRQESFEHKNTNSAIVAYAIMLRKAATSGGSDWINITPDSIDQSIIMVTEYPVTSDTFVPYQEPTDNLIETKARAYLTSTVGHACKNLYQITADTQTINGVTYTVDKTAGTITANGTSPSNSEASLKQLFVVTPQLAGKKYFSVSLNQTGSSTTFDAYLYDQTDRKFVAKWDGSTRSPAIHGTESQEVLLIEGHTVEFTCRIFKSQTVSNLIYKPMIRAGSISDDTFEPYRIPTDELIARLDQRIYELERINEIIEPDPDEGRYFITVFNNSGSDCDIHLSTPDSDGGGFFPKGTTSMGGDKHLRRTFYYYSKPLMVLFETGTSEIVMTLNSSQSGQGRFYKEFDSDEFLDMCDVKDGSATNYISIHLCDDGGIRSQAEYEAYIGG